MSPAELRKAVARAIVTAYGFPNEAPHEADFLAADAALAVVREAMRDPTQAMLQSCLDRNGSDDDLYTQIWRAMLAASPLGGDKP
jgi:erythromycin esterase-like protein